MPLSPPSRDLKSGDLANKAPARVLGGGVTGRWRVATTAVGSAESLRVEERTISLANSIGDFTSDLYGDAGCADCAGVRGVVGTGMLLSGNLENEDLGVSDAPVGCRGVVEYSDGAGARADCNGDGCRGTALGLCKGVVDGTKPLSTPPLASDDLGGAKSLVDCCGGMVAAEKRSSAIIGAVTGDDSGVETALWPSGGVVGSAM